MHVDADVHQESRLLAMLVDQRCNRCASHRPSTGRERRMRRDITPRAATNGLAVVLKCAQAVHLLEVLEFRPNLVQWDTGFACDVHAQAIDIGETPAAIDVCRMHD